MDKPFRSAEEQVDILESRGLKIADREDAVRTLLSWNYYTLVNGYKDMFLDPARSREAHDDRYVEGAYFEQLKLAYALDRGFRSATMDVLMQAESVMKTSLVHAFCQKYGGGDSYLEEGWTSRKGGNAARNSTAAPRSTTSATSRASRTL